MVSEVERSEQDENHLRVVLVNVSGEVGVAVSAAVEEVLPRNVDAAVPVQTVVAVGAAVAVGFGLVFAKDSDIGSALG
jgi:hypothetical protein